MSKQKPPRTPPPARAAAKPNPRAPAKPVARPVASPPPRAGSPAALESAVQRLEASVAELKRERDDLANRLAHAEAEIIALDTARKAAIDRIDWVIDSLHTALQDKA